MKTMTVIAARNPVPMEENSRRYIGTDKAAEVELTSYYRRRLGTGELVKYVAPAKPTNPSPLAAPAPKVEVK